MRQEEKVFRFLARLVLHQFYRTVTIRFDSGKVTHVEAEMRRSRGYERLPSDGSGLCLKGQENASGAVKAHRAVQTKIAGQNG